MNIPLYFDAEFKLNEDGSIGIENSRRLDLSPDHSSILEIDIIFRDPIFIHHYFHFLELIITAFTIIKINMPAAKVRCVYFGRQNWNNSAQNNVQKDMIEAILNPELILEGDLAEKKPFLQNIVLYIDRHESEKLFYNKYIENIISPAIRVFPDLRSNALDFAGALLPEPYEAKSVQSKTLKIAIECIWKALTGQKPATAATENGAESLIEIGRRALYVKRMPPRTFAPELEEQFLQLFANRGIRLEVIDFSNMSWAEQIRSTSRAHLLVGIHGNGLTNCLWMPPGATVIEIFPKGAHHYDYQMLSEVAGLRYFGVEGRAQDPFVFTDGSRFGAAHGSVNEPITELPWRWLDQILDKLES